MAKLDAHPLIVVLAATALGWNAVAGLLRGEAYMFYSKVARAEDPIGFWTAVAISGVLSAAAVLVLILQVF